MACRSAVLDGEMIVQDQNGVSDFGLLKSAIAHEPGRLALIAFDLLHLDGRDLRSAPLVERRAKLRMLLSDGESCIGFSEEFGGDATGIGRAGQFATGRATEFRRPLLVYSPGLSSFPWRCRCRSRPATELQPFCDLLEVHVIWPVPTARPSVRAAPAALTLSARRGHGRGLAARWPRRP